MICPESGLAARVDPATAEPCQPGTERWRACTAEGVDGRQRCAYVETGEDQGVYRWAPCLPACQAADRGQTRPCELEGHAGVQYCDEAAGADVPLWLACLPPACQACTPGDTKLCGPGTNYPDTRVPCGLSSGMPAWFEGDCST